LFLPFSPYCLLATVRRHVCRSVVFTLTVQSNNSLDLVTSLPVGSPVVGGCYLLAPLPACSAAFPLRMMNSYTAVLRSPEPR